MKAAAVIAFASTILAAAVKSPALDQRDDIKVLCGAPTNSPDNEFPASDYSYPVGQLLSGGNRRLHVDAGPGNCKQAACGSKGGAGVVICNDNHNAVDLLYTDIGFFAQRVYEACKHRRDGNDYVEKGQAFCPDGWNVILTDIGSHCNAPSISGSN